MKQKQVGGSHYLNLKMQPVQLFAETRCTPFQANVIKYLVRYKDKNGLEDLQKASHYASLAKELNCLGNLTQAGRNRFKFFCKENGLSEEQSRIIACISNDLYDRAIIYIKQLAWEQYKKAI